MVRNVYKRKDGRFEARVSMGKAIDGKRIYRSFYGRTREEALLKLNTFRNTQRRADSLTEITVRTLTREYLSVISPRLKESSLANYRMKAEKHIYPSFGTLRCCEITPAAVRKFVDTKMNSGLSVRYVSDIVILLKSVFRYAARTYGLGNPTENIVMPKKTKPPIVILTKNDQSRLLESIGISRDTTSLGIALSLFTGIRIGELCALKWKDIDIDSRTININKTIQRIQTGNCVHKTKLVITEPKSQGSIRIIPIPDCIVGLLKKQNINAEHYILSDSRKPVEPRTMQYRFANVLKKGNLPSVHFHSLRHAFATNCITLGFDVKTLSEILGHSSVEMTLNRYVHSSFDRKKACMDLLTWTA